MAFESDFLKTITKQTTNARSEEMSVLGPQFYLFSLWEYN